MNWIAYLLTAAAGIANPVQSGANSELKKSLQDPIWTALAVYGTAFCLIALAQLFAQRALPASGAAGSPWWAWIGGAVSIGSTMTGLMYAQKLGSGLYTGISVTAALVSSIVLDHFGLIGFKSHPVSAMRIVGGLLMIGGLWLIGKF